MDIFVPNKKLWIPDNTIADSLASPPAISRMIAYNTRKRICSLTPHRVMMGAAGGAVSGDATSYRLDGTGDYISLVDHADWDAVADTSNMTIDFWVKHTDHAGTESYFVIREDNINWWRMQHVHGTGITFNVKDANVIIITMPGAGEIIDLNWHHIAWIKVGTELGIYKDGTQISYVNDASTATFAGPLAIGGEPNFADYLDGNIDDFRFYHGNPFSAAPNATPDDTIDIPTTQHESDADTKLLILGGETKTGTTGSGATATDSGNTGHTYTENGNATEDTVNYKWG